MRKKIIIKNYFKHVFWKSYYNFRLPNFYMVTYTISNSKNNTIINNTVRNIVKKVLEDNGYICLYTKFNVKNMDYNLRYISLTHYEILCNFEKNILLEYIIIELSNNIDKKYLLECLKQIELNVTIL